MPNAPSPGSGASPSTTWPLLPWRGTCCGCSAGGPPGRFPPPPSAPPPAPPPRPMPSPPLPPPPPSTPPTRTNAPPSLSHRGRFLQASPYVAHPPADLPPVQAGRHPDTVAARANRASAHDPARDRGRALPLPEQTLTDRQRGLGGAHP